MLKGKSLLQADRLFREIVSFNAAICDVVQTLSHRPAWQADLAISGGPGAGGDMCRGSRRPASYLATRGAASSSNGGDM